MPDPSAPRPPRRIWLLIAAACLVPAALSAFQTYMQSKIGPSHPATWRSMIWNGSEWIIFGALTPLTYFLGRWLPLRKPHVARNLLMHICAALSVCCLWAFGGASLNWLLGNEREGLTRGQYLMSWTLTTLPYGTFMYFAVLGCVHAITYFMEVRERDAQTARLAASRLWTSSGAW
ncbi:MAG: hypothetical protein M3081_14530 [Gemmatimonadota bacterium]|nr:hypothetical protein [Gemmatimonadota bacterium]